MIEHEEGDEEDEVILAQSHTLLLHELVEHTQTNTGTTTKIVLIFGMLCKK